MNRGMSREIDVLERVSLGGIEQWLLLRGRAADLPALLHLQGGPGAPRIPEADGIERQLGLEEHFIVAYLDPRGAGKSHDRRHPPELSLARFTEDTVELMAHLHQRTGAKQVMLSGFSLGGSLAALVASHAPDRIRAFIGIGLDINYPASERHSYAFIVAEAKRRGNRRALRELEAIGPPPHDSRAFAVRVKWLMEFRGVIRDTGYSAFVRKTLWEMLRSPHYGLGDVVRAVQGMSYTQRRLLPELADFDLFARVPRLDVPFHLFQGRHDHAAPAELAEQYFEKLEAPRGKQLVWFENSAHMPHYEEPVKFREELLKIAKATA
jgi:pimeloyl-ACP methyl ester carboxylesterase